MSSLRSFILLHSIQASSLFSSLHLFLSFECIKITALNGSKILFQKVFFFLFLYYNSFFICARLSKRTKGLHFLSNCSIRRANFKWIFAQKWKSFMWNIVLSRRGVAHSIISHCNCSWVMWIVWFPSTAAIKIAREKYFACVARRQFNAQWRMWFL